MKVKIEVDDRNLAKAKDMTREIMFDILAKYPRAQANLASRDFKNQIELRI